MSGPFHEADASGTWWRHTPVGIDPSRRPSPVADSRWQRGNVVDALYLADSRECAWAEWYRHLAEAGIPPDAALPRDLWPYSVGQLRVADLSNLDRLADAGLPAPWPGRSSWPAFQHAGHSLWRAGWDGILAPSAARPTGMILVVFLTDGRVPEALTAGTPTRVDEAPIPPTGMRT